MLRLLVTRLVRSRAGLALLLAAVVLGIVGAARAVFPSGPDLTVSGPVPPLVDATPTAPDDGLLSPSATPSPTLVAGAAPAAVAKGFAARWVAHTGVSPEEWHTRLAERSTDALAQRLAGVSPEVVPAERITGDPVVLPQAPTIVDVVIPVDTGTLRLRLLAVDGRWLVDGIDWGRA